MGRLNFEFYIFWVLCFVIFLYISLGLVVECSSVLNSLVSLTLVFKLCQGKSRVNFGLGLILRWIPFWRHYSMLHALGVLPPLAGENMTYFQPCVGYGLSIYSILVTLVPALDFHITRTGQHPAEDLRGTLHRYREFWLYTAFSTWIFCFANFCYLGFAKFWTLSPELKSSPFLWCGLNTLPTASGTHLLCYCSLSSHCSRLPIVQCLKTILSSILFDFLSI